MSNQYSYSVPFSEEELFRDYVTLGMSQSDIAAKYGTTQKVVWRAMRKMNIPTRTMTVKDQRGELNPGWKGGRVLSSQKSRQRGERSSFGNGYYYIYDPTHPNAGGGGGGKRYVAEHIVVATRERGRPLERGEMVHHIDLDKHNNAPENLAITTAKGHAIWHAQLEEVAVTFMKEGRIAFDTERGYYRTDR